MIKFFVVINIVFYTQMFLPTQVRILFLKFPNDRSQALAIFVKIIKNDKQNQKNKNFVNFPETITCNSI